MCTGCGQSALRPAGQAAERALADFGRRGLSEHPVSLETLAVLVDAELMLAVWTPLPFTGREDKALERLRVLVERYTRQYGPDNP